MSVINQMLQDLEKRNTSADGETVSSPVVVTASPKSALLPVVLAVLITAILAAALWLYVENQSLKQQTQAQTSLVAFEQTPSAKLNQLSSSKKSEPQSNTLPLAEVAQTSTEPATPKVETIPAKPELQAEPQTQSVLEPQFKQGKQASESQDSTVNDGLTPSTDVAALNAAQKTTQKTVQKTTEKTGLQSTSGATSEAVSKAESATAKPSLTIARKQLTSVQLAAQKVNLAEQAMANKEGPKAEQLLQDALLVAPENKVARKQLAAIWFARGANQAAMNLLNQGIRLLPSEPDFRLMKAKILLKFSQQRQSQRDREPNQSESNQPEKIAPQLAQAYETLVVLPNVQQVEYQSLLATVAQQVQQLPAAINAYQQLVALQPKQAKWYLGLAIAFDQNSQFSNAFNAYQQALTIGGLSLQIQQFAQQRMTELGE